MTAKPSLLSKEEWLAAVHAIGKNTAEEALGMEVLDATDDTITVRMPITDVTRQPLGLLHGGMSMVLAESAASIHATWGIDLNEKIPVGIEISGSHLRSATEGSVRAEGRVLRRSQNFIVHAVDIIHEDTGKILSSARVTNFYRRLDEIRD